MPIFVEYVSSSRTTSWKLLSPCDAPTSHTNEPMHVHKAVAGPRNGLTCFLLLICGLGQACQACRLQRCSCSGFPGPVAQLSQALPLPEPPGGSFRVLLGILFNAVTVRKCQGSLVSPLVFGRLLLPTCPRGFCGLAVLGVGLLEVESSLFWPCSSG